jgi:hypothetical protein
MLPVPTDNERIRTQANKLKEFHNIILKQRDHFEDFVSKTVRLLKQWDHSREAEAIYELSKQYGLNPPGVKVEVTVDGKLSYADMSDKILAILEAGYPKAIIASQLRREIGNDRIDKDIYYKVIEDLVRKQMITTDGRTSARTYQLIKVA